jgi:hypothetical protein
MSIDSALIAPIDRYIKYWKWIKTKESLTKKQDENVKAIMLGKKTV